MKVKIFILLVMSCLGLFMRSLDCYAQVSSSSDLLNNAQQYDNKTITYKGEVIGDVMIRGDHAWIHVNDGTVAIGIWAPGAMTDEIRYVGDYRQKGDIVEVTGTFHRVCTEHGGDLDIHASEIKKVAPGNTVIRQVSRKKFRAGAYSLIFVILLVASKNLFQMARKRSRP
jgi:hypothetical protein